MAISTFISNTVSISSTEISLLNGNSTISSNTTSGVYQLFVDTNAMASGDQYQLKIYEKTINGGTQRAMMTSIISGAQSDPIYFTPSFILINGWDMSIKKLSGTDRSFDWSIRQVS